MSWGIFWSNLDGMKEVVGPDPEMFRTYVPDVTNFWKVCMCTCQLQLTRGLRKVYRTCSSCLGETRKWPFIRKTTSWAGWWSALVRWGTTLQHPHIEQVQYIQKTLPKEKQDGVKLTILVLAWYHLCYKEGQAFKGHRLLRLPRTSTTWLQWKEPL